MKLEDILPVGTIINFIDTGVTVKGYDQGCVILESLTGRGIRIMEASVFITQHAHKVGPYYDSYIQMTGRYNETNKK